MNEQIAQQLGIGVLAVALGLSGWLVPYRWNLLRLRRGLASLVPDRINQQIPKVIGSLLAVGGMTILFATATVGAFR